jgi:hypothetical protein
VLSVAAATLAGTAERVVAALGALTAQVGIVAGVGIRQVKLTLTEVANLELRDEAGNLVTVSGVIWEWYDTPGNTGGDPVDSGTVDVVDGEAIIQLPNSALTAGQFGTLVLFHPSDPDTRGVYRLAVV